jgi:hypothetical protein
LRRQEKETYMNRHSLRIGLGLALVIGMTALCISSPAHAFFPPDNVSPKIVVPPPPPINPDVPPPNNNCCCCDCPPPPGPHVRTPEPMTIVTSLIGLSVLGGLGLRKRLLGK